MVCITKASFSDTTIINKQNNYYNNGPNMYQIGELQGSGLMNQIKSSITDDNLTNHGQTTIDYDQIGKSTAEAYSVIQSQ